MSNFKQMNSNLKPREKLKKEGVLSLSDAELLAIIVQTGIKGKSVVELSQAMLEKHNGFEELFNLTLIELTKLDGIGEIKAIKLKTIAEICRRINIQSISKRVEVINCPNDVYEVTSEYKKLPQENFILICLNTKNQILSKKIIFVGTLNSVNIHPREIFKEAIASNSNQIVVVHNHPSGDLTPSQEDLEVTKCLYDCSLILGIVLVDHVIISTEGYKSIRKIHPHLFNK